MTPVSFAQTKYSDMKTKLEKTSLCKLEKNSVIEYQYISVVFECLPIFEFFAVLSP